MYVLLPLWAMGYVNWNIRIGLLRGMFLEGALCTSSVLHLNKSSTNWIVAGMVSRPKCITAFVMCKLHALWGIEYQLLVGKHWDQSIIHGFFFCLFAVPLQYVKWMQSGISSVRCRFLYHIWYGGNMSYYYYTRFFKPDHFYCARL